MHLTHPYNVTQSTIISILKLVNKAGEAKLVRHMLRRGSGYIGKMKQVVFFAKLCYEFTCPPLQDNAWVIQ